MISSLVDHQLLIRIDQHDGHPRFSMLETIREYASERLTETGEREACHRRHAAFFSAFAERYQLAEMLPDGERIVALIDSEYPNIRAALAWLEESGEAEMFLRLAAAMGIFWSGQGPYQEGRQWMERALAQGGTRPAADRMRALVRLGMIETYQAANEDAEIHLTEGLAIAQDAGDALQTAHALLGLGALAIQQGDDDRGAALLNACHAAALTMANRRHAEIMASWALANLSMVARAHGDIARAAELLEDGLTRMRKAEYTRGIIPVLGDLGDLAFDQGDLGRALGLYREALGLVRGYPGTRVVTEVVEAVAIVAAAGQAERTARLLGAAEALRERIGLRYRMATRRAAFEQAVAAARSALGEGAYAAAWSAGQRLLPEQAVAEALDPTFIPANPGTTLTPRETEILQLIAEGMSDPRIAETLFISVRTVQNHVAHILAKLGVRSRGAAGIAAGLMPPKTLPQPDFKGQCPGEFGDLLIDAAGHLAPKDPYPRARNE